MNMTRTSTATSRASTRFASHPCGNARFNSRDAREPGRRIGCFAASKWSRLAILVSISLVAACGCSSPPEYGRENITYAPQYGPRTMAVAPAINLSGQSGPDALLQADIVYQQLQAVRGVTVIPVNRVVQVCAGLGIRNIDTREQAVAVCEALGADALIVPTITAFDPYNPPKMGASVQLFVSKYRDQDGGLDVRQLSRQATEGPVQSLPKNADFIQAARLFDASSGSTRDRLRGYAAGRNDPGGPLGEREFYLNMDRYAAFVWHELIDEVLERFAD